MRRKVDHQNTSTRPTSSDPDYVPVEQTLFELFKKHAPAEENMYEDVDVKVEGILDAPSPIDSLKEANFSSKILFNASKVGITKLTPIQKHSFPIVAENRDIMVKTQIYFFVNFFFR